MLHYTNGYASTLLPYLVSCVGSALGLQSMVRARSTIGGTRFWWLVLSAVSIGGTGIWAMHFIAMLDFHVADMLITYDVPITVGSLLVAVAVVGVGLTLAVRGAGRGQSLLLGGIVTGLGVACMHYIGMAAMRVPASTSYDWRLVGASVAIAVVAATAAMWAAMNVRGFFATAGTALVMGLAICGMHYTGTAALKVGAMDASMVDTTSGGMAASQLLAPLGIALGATTLIMLFLVVLAPPEHELRSEAELNGHLEAIRSGRHRQTGNV